MVTETRKVTLSGGSRYITLPAVWLRFLELVSKQEIAEMKLTYEFDVSNPQITVEPLFTNQDGR